MGTLFVIVKNVVNGELHILHYLKNSRQKPCCILLVYDIYSIELYGFKTRQCVHAAEVKMDDDIILLGIQGFSLEHEKTLQTYSRRTLIYIRESTNYEKCPNLKNKMHMWYALKSRPKICVKHQYIIRTSWHTKNSPSTHRGTNIRLERLHVVGNGYRHHGRHQKNDYSYHLRRIYDKWTKFEQDHLLDQTVDFVTWRRKNGSNIIMSILYHVYTNNCCLLESVEEANYLLGYHSPVVVTLMKTTRTKKGQLQYKTGRNTDHNYCWKVWPNVIGS